MIEDVRFSIAEINIVVHATEDKSIILRSLHDVLSVSEEKFSSVYLDGHFGNEIVLLTANIAAPEANALASKIILSMGSIDRIHLSKFFNKYIDEKGNLYIRLDKQKLCQGKISLFDIDSIRIRFRPIRKYRPTNNLETYRRFFTLNE